MTSVLRWAAEVGGVAIISAGLWWQVAPLAGILIIGVYLIALANDTMRGGE